MIKHRKQNGGTLTGLVIGMAVGLLIAIGVAIMITGTSTPFSSMVSTNGEAKDGKVKVGGDPNEPLYPKRDLMESVAREMSRKMESEGKSAAEALKAVTPLLGRKEETPATATTVTVPPQKVAMQVQRDKPQPVDGLIYYLQAGAFLNKNEAEGVKGRLALLGLAADLSERPSESGTLYRVRIGPYSQIEEMREARTILADNGIQSVVVRP